MSAQFLNSQFLKKQILWRWNYWSEVTDLLQNGEFSKLHFSTLLIKIFKKTLHNAWISIKNIQALEYLTVFWKLLFLTILNEIIPKIG